MAQSDNSVPVEELEALAREWRKVANQEGVDTDFDRTLRHCARELEEVIYE